MESQTMSLVSVDSTKHANADHITRPCLNFSPSIWGDVFLQYDSQPMEIEDYMKKQAQMQKEEVRKIFQSSSNNISQMLNFIDSLQRLGISYHFEHEIDEALEQIHNNLTKNKEIIIEEGDLHFLGLIFRLLRQKGHHISPAEIFEKFKNNNGNFKENITEDIQGMWSLYEAAQLRIHGEDILDEALDFTYSHLNSLDTNQLSPFLATQLFRSLKTPFHKGVPRLETKCYISSYAQEPSHSKVLLNFAKLDFNMMQKMHQKELGNITRWWRNAEYATKVPYARDRVTEPYLWPMTMSFEPEYSTGRTILGKLLAIVSLVDDTYDAYGTVEELELFTEAIKRWDISIIQSLPESMKVVFNAIVDLWGKIEEITIFENGQSSLELLPYIKLSFYNLIQAYMVEARWCSEGYIPSYDAYKSNGLVSATYPFELICFLGFGPYSNKELLDWIMSNPTIILVVAAYGRLADDMASHKFEQERVHVASAVECCMKQYNISTEEAYKLILKELEDYWIIMNEECLKLDHVPRPVLEYILNLARVTEFTYEDLVDKYTKWELMKDYVAALLIDPIN